MQNSQGIYDDNVRLIDSRFQSLLNFLKFLFFQIDEWNKKETDLRAKYNNLLQNIRQISALEDKYQESLDQIRSLKVFIKLINSKKKCKTLLMSSLVGNCFA